eukprot:CAMPEP_0177642638 /NCGR_PEP_ID=MMETSP0447-20121125/7696_1 /TAXON_ID=0 /ORGANISM="Stygamoeba regulata, Strain BSH-02190019" /LENGTH=282 /DNA_ID=CAMNT_0019144815 /DNA_START=71 /DNA_END=919 /DNA_ORIENTATION=-
MSDPFGDIDDLISVDELQVSKSTSPLSSSAAPAPVVRSISTVFPPELREKATADMKEREEYESKIAKLVDELHATRERLYQLRFDTSSSKEDVVRNVKNHIQEVARLEQAINRLRKRSLLAYTASLQLSSLDLDASKLFQPLLQRDPSLKTFNLTNASDSGASTSAHVPASTSVSRGKLEEEEDYGEMEPLMRTQSTHVLKDKPAQEKWQGLFRMFREWKHHKQVAEASHIANRQEGQDMLEGEIAKLRAAIYSLRQRKQLNNSDKELLRILTAKLKALHQL